MIKYLKPYKHRIDDGIVIVLILLAVWGACDLIHMQVDNILLAGTIGAAFVYSMMIFGFKVN